MPLGVPFSTLALVFAVVLAGGLVKGVAGFGYAVVATAALASVLDPATAVVLLIVPTLVANLSLLRELDREALSSCLRQFGPYLAGAVVGTLVGMALLGRVPKPVLALGLGLFTAAYVVARQPYVAVPGLATLRDYCFSLDGRGMAALGVASGAVFGVANAAVQVVAYLDSRDLDRSTFVGVLSMVLVGISTVRVGAAAALGLYEGAFALSVAAAVPGLVGVSVGNRLRPRIPERYQTAGTLLLLAVIATRLTVAGARGLL
ncbi:MAG: TSUP family transporter [Haloglomus sp.]